MDKPTAEHIKDLIADNQLEQALNLLIGIEQLQGMERHNTLLLLKGRLAMIKEQELAGLLDMDEIVQQKLKISHAVLKMLDEKPEAFPEGRATTTKRAESQKAQPAQPGKPWAKYLLFGLGILVAGFLVFRLLAPGTVEEGKTENPGQVHTDQTTVEDQPTNVPADKPLKVLDFPNLKKPFNFLDFGLEFAWADAEWVSDQEIRLKIRYYLTCKSNLGICYRAAIRIYADGKPIAPASQSNLDGWIEHEATATDDVTFVLPAGTKDFLIEFSRDHSTWKRPFKILK
ncbi:MAG: hypothetical protein H6577_12690 [Lewinellaceae bacterium]|nr:hypothetical protein [Saprospiraceae bacterium]MCB9338979.1 hypothetical protein [Lewinellaceae bacterium]